MKNKYGAQVSVWLSTPIYERFLEASRKIGLSQSGFVKYAVLRELERLEAKEEVKAS